MNQFELGIFFRSSQLVGEARRVEQAWTKTGRVLDDVTRSATRSGRAVDAYGQSAQRATRTTQDALSTFNRSSRVVDDYGQQVERLTVKTDAQSTSTAKFTKQLAGMARQIVAVGAAFLTLQAGMTAVSGASREFGAIETGLVGVQKTTNLADAELAKFNVTLSELAVDELPILKTEMLELAQVSGQLGVTGRENLEEYVRTLGELAAASDLVGEEGAKTLTRMLNVQGEGPENIRRLATVIVDLGNTAAASEREIARMATEVALATAPFKIGTTVAAAFGTAMVESGIRSELGGSVIGRTLRAISAAVIKGGDELERFAHIAGVSSEELAKAWSRSPVEALNLFLRGLRRFGQEAPIALESVKLKGEEVMKVLPTLAGNFEKLAERQRQAATEAVEMNALTEESRRAFSTQDSDLRRLTNSFSLLQEKVGAGLSPALRENAGRIKELTLANQEAAEFGAHLGSVLTFLVGVLAEVVEHADLLKAAFLSWLMLKVAGWITALTALFIQAIAKMIAYTTATAGATAAQAALGTTVAKTIPIFGAQGQVVSVVTRQMTVMGGATAAAAGAQNAMAGSSRFLSMSLTPLTIGLAAVLGAVLLANDAISGWSRNLDREIQGIVESSEEFFTGIQRIKDASSELLDAANQEAEIRRRLMQEGLTADDPRAERVRTEVAAEFHRKRVELLLEQEAALEKAAAKEADFRAELDATVAKLPELEAAFESARVSMVPEETATGTRVKGVEEFDKASAAMGRARAEAEKLEGKWNEAHIEANTLRGTVADLRGEVETYVPAARRAADETGVVTDKLRTQQDQLQRTITSLNLEAQALDRLAAAALKRDESFSKAQRALEIEKRFQSEAAKLTEVHADKLKKLRQAIVEVVKAEKNLAGSKTITNLERQRDKLQEVITSYEVGIEAAEATNTALKIEAEQRSNAAHGTDEQRSSIESLTMAVAALQQISEAKRETAGILEEIANLRGLSDAYDRGRAAVEEYTAARKADNEVGEAMADLSAHGVALSQELAEKMRLLESVTGGMSDVSNDYVQKLQDEIAALLANIELTESQRESLERAIRARIELTKSIALKEYVQSLEEEANALRLEHDLLHDASLAQRLFGDATEAVSKELAVQQAILAAGKDATPEYIARIRKAVEEAFDLRDQIDATSDLRSAWQDFAGELQDVLGGIDSDLGLLVGTFRDLTAAVSDYYAARQAGDVQGQSIASQRIGGTIVGGVASYLGSNFSGGGQSRFGGRMSGTYGGEGASLGAKFGPQWALLGFIFGSFVKKGADDLEVALTNAGAEILKAEGGLSELATQIADVLNSFVAQFELVIGREINIAGANLVIDIRDNILKVAVNGVEQAFDDLDSAIAWGLEQVLSTIDKSGLGENLAHLLSQFQPGSGTNIGSVEELTFAINLAQTLDDLEVGAGATSVAIRDLNALHRKEVDIALRYRLPLEKVLDLHQQRLAQLKAEIGLSRDSMLGVSGSLQQVREIVRAMEDYNRGVSADYKQRQDRIAELNAAIAILEQEIAAAAKTTTTAATDISGAQSEIDRDLQDLGNGVLGVGDTTDDATRALIDHENELRRMRRELEALLAGIGKIPETFSAQEIADLWTVAAVDAGQALINLIRRIRGEEFGIAEERELQTKLFALQLAAQVSAVQTLLVLTETLDESTRALLQGLIDEATVILGELASGVQLPDIAGGGRGGRQQRREERARLIEEARALRMEASGLADTTRSLLDQIAAYDEWIDAAVRMGLAEATIAQARRDQLTILERTLLEPFQRVIQRAGMTGSAGDAQDLAAGYGTAFADALIIAGRAAETFGSTVEEEYARLAAIIGEALQIEAVELYADAISSLVENRDIEGLERLGDELDALIASNLPDDVRANLAAIAAQVHLAITEGIAAAREAGLAEIFGELAAESDLLAGRTGPRDSVLDLRERRDDQLARAEELGAAEEDLARIRELHAVAVRALVTDFLAEVQEWDDAAQGISDLERRLIDLQQTFADVRTGVIEAEQDLGDLSATFARLERAQQAATRSLGVEFINSLDRLGISVPTDLTLELALAQFELGRAEAVASALALYAAGAFEGLSISLDELLGIIAGAEFDPSAFLPQQQQGPSAGGGRGGGGSGGGEDQLDSLRQQVEDQIEAWNRLPLGDVTMQAINLVETLVQLRANAEAAGVAVDRVDAAFQSAMGHFVDEALTPFENLNLNPLETELNGIVDQFVNLLVAFETAGASAEDMARLQDAFNVAMEDFLERATQGIRNFLDELRATDPRVSGQQAFETSQSEFRDLLAAAQSGDLEALSQLEGAARSFRENALAFLGGGVGFQEVLDEIIGGLESVEDIELVPEDIQLLREQADALINLIDISASQPTVVTQDDSFSRVSSGLTLIEDAVGTNAGMLQLILAQLETGELTIGELSEILSVLDALANDVDFLPDNVGSILDALTGVLLVADELTAGQVDNVLGALGGILNVSDALGPDQLNAMITSFQYLSELGNLTANQTSVLSGMISSMLAIEGLSAAQESILQTMLISLGVGFSDVVDAVYNIPIKSAQTGAFVRKDGLIFVHANERILNPKQTQAFEALGGLPGLSKLSGTVGDRLTAEASPGGRNAVIDAFTAQLFANLSAQQVVLGFLPRPTRRPLPPPLPPPPRKPVVIPLPPKPPPPPPRRSTGPVPGPKAQDERGRAVLRERPLPEDVPPPGAEPGEGSTADLTKALEGFDNEPVVDRLDEVRKMMEKTAQDESDQAREKMKLQVAAVANGTVVVAIMREVQQELAELRREMRLDRNSKLVGGAS